MGLERVISSATNIPDKVGQVITKVQELIANRPPTDQELMVARRIGPNTALLRLLKSGDYDPSFVADRLGLSGREVDKLVGNLPEVFIQTASGKIGLTNRIR